MPAAPKAFAPTTERWITRAVGRYCREHARNLFIASFFLPPRKRVAMQAVGGFVRMLEEVFTKGIEITPAAATSSAGSACSSGSDLDRRMQMVRERLDGIYAGDLSPPAEGGDPEHAVIHILAGAIQRYQIAQQWFINLAEATRSKVSTLRWATWSSLSRNLSRGGGSVGLILSAIFGATGSEAQEHAVQMGVAVELTRILRDLKMNAAQKRVLLPLEDLARFRYSDRELAAGVVNENFRALMRFQIERARELYRAGAEGICWLGGDGSKLAAASVAVLYSGVLRQIERNDYDVFSHPIRLSGAQRLRRMADAWRLARRRVGDREVRGWERR